MSWENSETRDMLRGTRKLVLSVAEGMDMLMDIIDPLQCERYGVDRDGEPLDSDPDTYTTLEFLFMWGGKLKRVNGMLYELNDRIIRLEDKVSELEGKEVEDGGSGSDSGA